MATSPSRAPWPMRRRSMAWCRSRTAWRPDCSRAISSTSRSWAATSTTCTERLSPRCTCCAEAPAARLCDTRAHPFPGAAPRTTRTMRCSTWRSWKTARSTPSVPATSCWRSRRASAARCSTIFPGRTAPGAAEPALASAVAHVEDRETHRPAGQLRFELVVRALLQHGAGERGIDADPAEPGVGFVGADDAVAGGLAAAEVLDLDVRAEEHRLRIGGRALHHPQCFQALAEVADAPVDLAQLLLAVAVLGVLGTVALGRGCGQRTHHLGTLEPPQRVEFGLQPRVALRGDQGGALLGGRTPATQAVVPQLRRRLVLPSPASGAPSASSARTSSRETSSNRRSGASLLSGSSSRRVPSASMVQVPLLRAASSPRRVSDRA